MLLKTMNAGSRALAAIAFAGATLAAGPLMAQIKIGAPLALTGGLADEGKKQSVAYDMWLKRVNAAGGISVGGKKLKIEVIERDDEAKNEQAFVEGRISVHILTG